MWERIVRSVLYVYVACCVGTTAILVCNYFAAICIDNDAMIAPCYDSPECR